MKHLLFTLSISSLLVSGLSSCSKDYKDKDSNAYKILGTWTPQKHVIRYTDFNGEEIVYERTSFNNNIWEFNKKKLLYIHYASPENAPYSYRYSIKDAKLTIGDIEYNIIQLDEHNLNYLEIAAANDTALVDGQPVGIIRELEWQFSK